jgi:hypothetical protein
VEPELVYHAAPGSRSAQALALLATTIAGEREPVRLGGEPPLLTSEIEATLRGAR